MNGGSPYGSTSARVVLLLDTLYTYRLLLCLQLAPGLFLARRLLLRELKASYEALYIPTRD
jgi:hypothetical protein